MSYEQRNLKVFLSSSMGEFRHERDAIKQELDSLGIQNFVFEHEGASDQAPAERFQNAVRGASVYIGVFGKQCGKYTREEFETARTQKIACLLYVQHMRDEERSEELEFLRSLNGVTNVPTISEFQSTDGLVARIKKDLVAWMDKQIGREHSDKDRIDQTDRLPILCDRYQQERELQGQISQYFKTGSTRPLLLILQGRVEEKHEFYLDRIKWWSLEKHLAGGKGKVLTIQNRPLEMTSPDDVRREILALLLPQHEKGKDEDIVAYMEEAKLRAVLIDIRLLTSECGGNPHESFQVISDYLAAFPDTKESVLVSVMVSLQEDEQHSLWTRWRKKHLLTKSVQGLEERYRDNAKLILKVLPRLEPQKAADVRRWINHELVKLIVGEKEIEGIFQRRKSLPMGDLYPQLVDLLRRKRPAQS
jgi:hypothetical protein